jgi:hypothetical protein
MDSMVRDMMYVCMADFYSSGRAKLSESLEFIELTPVARYSPPEPIAPTYICTGGAPPP